MPKRKADDGARCGRSTGGNGVAADRCFDTLYHRTTDKAIISSGDVSKASEALPVASFATFSACAHPSSESNAVQPTPGSCTSVQTAETTCVAEGSQAGSRHVCNDTQGLAGQAGPEKSHGTDNSARDDGGCYIGNTRMPVCGWFQSCR